MGKQAILNYYIYEFGGHYLENNTLTGEISGSHGSEYDDGCLLGCCAM
jgi:hypothetical protein